MQTRTSLDNLIRLCPQFCKYLVFCFTKLTRRNLDNIYVTKKY